ncbi:MAG: histidine--tRNA ligase [Candidatus Aenigmarchaeota archaeon]|nr:histidine--tRNA ligase [Candidatus Aenigmarchaeota archaeon]
MLQAPKGTKDYLPAEMRKRRFVMDRIREVFEKYGYSEVCTPAFENIEVFEKKGGIGDENIKDIYRFQDKSERWLGLRFEMTIVMPRLLMANPNLPKPIKWYYVANLWRYEATRKGRQREFWQAGVENMGKKDELVDAEILAITYDALKAIGIENFTMKVNSRKLISKIADKYSIKDKTGFFRLIDKKEKMPQKIWADELSGFFKKEKDAEEFMNISKMPWKEAKKELSSFAKEDIDYLEKILDYSKSFGIDKNNLEIDLLLMRGLDYYTDFIFETVVPGEKDLGSIAGGGRYDTMMESFGAPSTPATGMAIGIERVMEILGDKLKTESPLDVLILPIEETFMKNAVELAKNLRAEGIKCDIEIMRSNFKKKMAYASDIGARFVAIIGKDEAEKGLYTLKNMETSEQKTVALKDTLKLLK